jgi:hypothetical protein
MVNEIRRHFVKVVPYPAMMMAVIIDKAMEEMEDTERPKDAIANEGSEHKLGEGGKLGAPLIRFGGVLFMESF